ncbi:hypothetical protein PF005_g20043 [Phytophthora fragariae]|uniref:Secreted protein n=1 Tax=Phytophthora fragariae TaxID=53985 RepID=A0A6A3SZ51_9STRA|nr:hypothetical protein PF003_g6635 [Phytophthora fragariae]KAE9102539.1 hypothetical protein PF007_g14724 [Phytophthora fragariae]KAE9121089.1 hypothetical protein PF006_g17988 [Phytophthora fragariae]KAE9188479.1 hypothetical protein PF005_g20043 [Phytophthora fragariae]KAE9216518.1 hypothetical protein PF002_g17064 [Phytophthora fragariae]
MVCLQLSSVLLLHEWKCTSLAIVYLSIAKSENSRGAQSPLADSAADAQDFATFNVCVPTPTFCRYYSK